MSFPPSPWSARDMWQPKAGPTTRPPRRRPTQPRHRRSAVSARRPMSPPPALLAGTDACTGSAPTQRPPRRREHPRRKGRIADPEVPQTPMVGLGRGPARGSRRRPRPGRWSPRPTCVAMTTFSCALECRSNASPPSGSSRDRRPVAQAGELLEQPPLRGFRAGEHGQRVGVVARGRMRVSQQQSHSGCSGVVSQLQAAMSASAQRTSPSPVRPSCRASTVRFVAGVPEAGVADQAAGGVEGTSEDRSGQAKARAGSYPGVDGLTPVAQPVDVGSSGCRNRRPG